MSSPGGLVYLALGAAALASGCSAASARSQFSDYLARQVAVVQAQMPPKDPANTLLVQGEDDNLYLVSPDGARRFALTTDASARRSYAQPSVVSRRRAHRLDRAGWCGALSRHEPF